MRETEAFYTSSCHTLLVNETHPKLSTEPLAPSHLLTHRAMTILHPRTNQHTHTHLTIHHHADPQTPTSTRPIRLARTNHHQLFTIYPPNPCPPHSLNNPLIYPPDLQPTYPFRTKSIHTNRPTNPIHPPLNNPITHPPSMTH